MEFALAWPVALVLVLGAVETAVWGSELFAARSAALAGARAGARAALGVFCGALHRPRPGRVHLAGQLEEPAQRVGVFPTELRGLIVAEEACAAVVEQAANL